MRYALAVALMLSFSFGLVTESFRYQSTAGIFEDDYDLLFDPARITEISGSRLWTNLANFVSGTEEHFVNGSAPYVLIGGVTDLNGYYPGMVYDRTSQKNALWTGLGPEDNPLYGEGTVTTTDWVLDPDGDPIGRTVSTETRTAYDAFNSGDFYAALATKRDGLRLGLGFMHMVSKYTLTDPANNYILDYFVEDLEADPDTLEYRNAQTSAGDNISKDGENDIILSIWSDKENISYGLTAEYGMLDHSDESVILYNQEEYDYPEHPDTSFTKVGSIDSVMLPQTGNEISLELKSFYNYNANAQGRFYIGLFTQSYDYSDDAIRYFNETREESYNDFTFDTTTAITYHAGTSSSKGITAGTKQLFTLSDKVKFGFGLFFTTSSYNDSVAMRDTSVFTEVYDDGDTVSLDPDDYQWTVWGGETWVRQVEGSTKEFNIPVGVEFYLAKPLVMRLGADYTLTYTDYTTTDTLAAYIPEHTRIEYGDGTIIETIDQDYAEDYIVETTKETHSVTDYVYGIGWHVSDNLQIDLMHFNELTDLSNWRLSATFKFD